MAQRLRFTAISLLLASSSTHGRTQHNRRKLRQPLESKDEERAVDIAAGKVEGSDGDGSNKKHGFYDLSPMTYDEVGVIFNFPPKPMLNQRSNSNEFYLVFLP